MKVITRFAPSPTGFLHIGGARTALFNYLFAKHHNGKYLLRIEDTDKKRSTPEAINAIKTGLQWLSIPYDGKIVFQSKNEKRHREIAHKLVELGKAYYCYLSKDELTEIRNEAIAKNLKTPNTRVWRDNKSTPPKGIKPTVRLKMPIDGKTEINDLVQGKTTISNETFDDFVILRADGTPTYMLAVCVDDHDMGVTHVIRGDDHLINSFKQYHIYKNLSWSIPEFAHIPLIHGPDGKKLSKRHGALGIEYYRDELDYFPEAIKNYLTRLGWSHGDDEIFKEEQAIKWFDVKDCKKSPARIDFKKMESVNTEYLKSYDDDILTKMVVPTLGKNLFMSLFCEKLRASAVGNKSLLSSLTRLNLIKNFDIFSKMKNHENYFEKIREKIDFSMSKNIADILKYEIEVFENELAENKSAENNFVEKKFIKNKTVKKDLEKSKNQKNKLEKIDSSNENKKIKREDETIQIFTNYVKLYKNKSSTLNELEKNIISLIIRPIFPFADQKLNKMITNKSYINIEKLVEILYNLDDDNWNADNLENIIGKYIKDYNYTFKDIGPPMRIALSGTLKSPPIHEILFTLGKDESVMRLKLLKINSNSQQ